MSGFSFSFNIEGGTDPDSSTWKEIKPKSNVQNEETYSSATKPPLHLLKTSNILNGTDVSPQTWKRDSIPVSSLTLERIDIHERPFDKNEADMNTNSAGGKNNKNPHNRQHHNDESSDLIHGFYEGGLKVWECSLDLCHHLLDLYQGHHSDLLGSGGRVLELGCGHGLPSILVLKLLVERYRSSEIHDFHIVFADYNGFVLRDVTLPNIILNCLNNQDKVDTISDLSNKFSLVAGDWLDMSKKLLDSDKESDKEWKSVPSKYDLILAAETTYTLQSAKDTAYLLLHHLQPETGVGFIATKRYYFGVGGGSDAFKAACDSMTTDGTEAIDNEDVEMEDDCDGKGNNRYRLSVDLVKEYKDGKSNIRDLWRVQCIQI
ncbi:hypothetical protein CTEN210_03217 [Chaetoceros tenuissimus]|uniref:protein-histidine N-methyltransferase n=1 Tax=Chaetoceros tenuissimus TaxID=426638 RepID=A0AAD3H1K0_9STRA|nr:hypothetical protein CTEN210_03217 [Chaetoceros tenuissimus]